MSFSPQKVTLIHNNYDNFFGIVRAVLEDTLENEDLSPYSIYNSTLHEKFNIFTTNYDTAIEKYFAKLGYTSYDTGAIDNFPEVDMDRFIRRYYCASNENRMKLLKLHGSINWIIDNKNKILQKGLNDNLERVLEEHEPGTITNEVIIYPLSQKQLYLSPFIQMYYHFNRELKENKIWLIIGYSFRDSVIKTMFESSINGINKILIIDPKSESIKESFNEECQQKIITINSEFGDNKSDITNKEFATKFRQIVDKY